MTSPMTARPTVMLTWCLALPGAPVPSVEGTTLHLTGRDAISPARSREPRPIPAHATRSDS